MVQDTAAWKAWIARWVAHKLFPNNGDVDEDQDISDNARDHSGTIAVQINFLTDQVAQTHSLTWENVTPSDVESLQTVKALMDLIVQHLS